MWPLHNRYLKWHKGGFTSGVIQSRFFETLGPSFLC